MLTRTKKVNMLAVIALLACVAGSNAAPIDEPNLGPCRDQNYSRLVLSEPEIGHRPVKIFEMPKAEYPESAYHARVSGKVVLNVRFLAAGRVGTVEVVSGQPGFTEEAAKAARRIRFLPARLDGRLTNSSEIVEYYFADPRRCSLDQH
jgi:TonB family protein